MIAQETIECEWQEVGLLFVFDDEKSFTQFGKTDVLLRQYFGIGATRYDGQKLVELEPAIKSGFGGGWHCEGDCHIRRDKFLSQMRSMLQQRGVNIVEDMPVSHFVRESGLAKTIHGDKMTIEAQHFVRSDWGNDTVFKSASWCEHTDRVWQRLFVDDANTERMPKIPIIFDDSHVAITPMKSKYRIG